MMAVSAFAVGEDSGGGAKYQQAAKRLFNQLSPQDAWGARQFNKKIGNVYLPGTSTYVKPTGLCISGSIIKSKGRIQGACMEWEYISADGERKRTMKHHLAIRKDAKCIRRATREFEHPINYTVEQNIYGVKDREGKVRTYTSYSKATEKGSPFVHSTKTVSRSMPQSFKADFFRATAQKRFERDKYLGAHKYRIGNCK